jgi:23S rRNA (guanosine2251-2'-O)-methyltransferase
MSNPKRKATHDVAKGRAYWLYGIHAVQAALGNPKREIRRLVVTQQVLEKLGTDWQERKLGAEVLSPHEINRLLPEHAVHQGAAVEIIPLPEQSLESFLEKAKEQKPLLLLDQVTDPHNVGAILRSAAAFGAGAVIVTRDHAPQETATLAKASSGALEIVPFLTVTNLTQCMELLKKHGYWCVGLDGEAKQTISQAKLGHTTALVLGSEGKGLRRLTAERCDLLVRLPISPVMESLNVSNAAAVALYTLTQQG